MHSSLVSSLGKCESYEAMKKELDAEIAFLKDFGPDLGKTGNLVFAARASGLRVRALFQKAGGKKPFARPKFKVQGSSPHSSSHGRPSLCQLQWHSQDGGLSKA